VRFLVINTNQHPFHAWSALARGGFEGFSRDGRQLPEQQRHNQAAAPTSGEQTRAGIINSQDEVEQQRFLTCAQATMAGGHSLPSAIAIEKTCNEITLREISKCIKMSTSGRVKTSTCKHVNV
jgi:hypothetical protein